MKGNKRFLSLLAGLTISGTLPYTGLAATSFSDIDNSYAKDAIQKLADAGIIQGTGTGSFNPTGQMTRQDFAIILARALKLDTSSPPATATFSDIPKDHYAYAAVEAAARAGLISGMANGTFGTGSNLSRQDMAVLFARAMEMNGQNQSAGGSSQLSFSDSTSISDYAKDAVALAVKMGLISGNSDGTFNPQGNAERQAVAFVASKFLDVQEKLKNAGTTPPLPGNGNNQTAGSTSGSTPGSSSGGGSGGSGGSGGGAGGGKGSDNGGDKPTPQPVNHAPIVAHHLADVSMMAGDIPMSISLEGVFSDEDGDNLSVSVSSTDSTRLMVSLADNKVTLSPVAEGKATVILVARDGRGGEVTSSFEVTIKPVPEKPNHPPVVKKALTDEYLYTGSSKSINLSGIFFDEDADPLTLSAVSNNSGIASVTVAGNELRITPISAGTATITITADDGKGSATTSFAVTVLTPPPPVTNHPPMVANPISPVTVTLGNANGSEVFLDGVFTDADNDTLSYEVRSGNTNIATVSLTHSGLTISPVAVGTTKMTVIARDGKGGSASTTFDVTVNPAPVENHPPSANNERVALEVSVHTQKDLNEYFTDTDGDILTFTLDSFDNTYVDARVSGNTLTFYPLAVGGPTRITVTASDGRGGSASTTFEVTVPGPPLPPQQEPPPLEQPEQPPLEQP